MHVQAAGLNWTQQQARYIIVRILQDGARSHEEIRVQVLSMRTPLLVLSPGTSTLP